jgi:hypothetical protein
LAARIGDDSNLTLDPDLDTYYVQDIAVGKLPTLGARGESGHKLSGRLLEKLRTQHCVTQPGGA